MAELGFWNLAQEDPAWIAVVDPEGVGHRAGDILGRVNQLSNGLTALGLEVGDGIASLLPNSIGAVEVYLAALQSGWYTTPVNFHLTAPEVAYILGDSEAKAFFASPRYADVAIAAADEIGFPAEARFSIGGPIRGFRPIEELVEGQPATAPAARTAGTAMHYTSGTTGQPKGVRRALTGLDPDTSAELMAMFLLLFGIEPRRGHVHLVTSPNYHTAVTQFGGNSLHAGHTLVLMDKWTAEGTLDAIQRHQVTTTHMVPTQFHRMLALPDSVRAQYDVSSMTHAIHAAAPCPVDVKFKMLSWFCPVIYEYYAATEGGGTLATPQDWLAHPGTVGNAWPISTLRIVDDDGNELPTGEPGTVYMKMSSGDFEYKGDKDKTEASRLEGYFTVGDIGYLTEDGFLFLNDRKADMIISGGVNIYPAEIEGEILAHPAVGDAAVFGIPNTDWGEEIKAVIEPAEGVEPTPELAAEILAFLEPRLARFKWPKTVDFIETMPRDPTGKLYKRKLRDPYWEGRVAI